MNDVVSRKRHKTGNQHHNYGMTRLRGSLSPRSKLTEADVVEIRSIEKPNLSNLARQHNVTVAAIWNIVHRKTWNHI